MANQHQRHRLTGGRLILVIALRIASCEISKGLLGGWQADTGG
jgi:hypothetical protein